MTCQLFRYPGRVSETEWLTPVEQLTWRRLLRLNALLPGALHRDLQEDAGLSLPDFAVLTELTEDPARRLRVSELARGLHWERSRVSHHVARMERRGLVRREECSEDGRGAWIVVAEEGQAAVDRAAPGHVETVRRLVFEVLSGAEVETMSVALGKVVRALEDDLPPGVR